MLANSRYDIFGLVAGGPVCFVSVQALVQRLPLGIGELESALVGRDAIPELFNQMEALLD